MKNISIYLIVFLFIISALSLNGQVIPEDSLYLGETPPGNIPKLFQLPVSSGFFAAERIAISSDGSEIYYSELNGYPPSHSSTKCVKYVNNIWTAPAIIFENYYNPEISNDGKTMFWENNNTKTFISTRTGDHWTTPVPFLPSANLTHDLRLTNKGNYYLSATPLISTTGDISILKISGTDTTINNLGIPLNSVNNGFDYFISRDESYIIRVVKSNGLGKLYISFHKDNGTWTNPKPLGDAINASSSWEWGPYVTNDNKCLFFTRQQNNIGIYWVRFDSLMDSLRHTNFAPYLKNPVPNQTAFKNVFFSYHVPDSTFIDDDGNNTLIFSAALSNGNSLPEWLSFNPQTQTFSGKPAASGTVTIKVTAADAANASTLCNFNISVLDAIPEDSLFLGQISPGDTPKKFEIETDPGYFATDRIAFSPDGSEIYFSETTGYDWSNCKTKYYRYTNNKWNAPEPLFNYFAPAFSVTGDTLFVENNAGSSWYSVRSNGIWSAANTLDFLGNPADKSYLQMTNNGNYYVSSRTAAGSVGASDISEINISNGVFTVQSLGAPLNSADVDGGFYISRDDSLIILTSNRGNAGRPDLYISFKTSDNKWTSPLNMGTSINTTYDEYGAYLTPDNKYLFFSRCNLQYTSGNIYWVRVDSLIDSLKKVSLNPTGTKEAVKDMVPEKSTLFQNYPNPFNPTTTIQYSLHQSSEVKLIVFNLLGQKIKTLINSFQNPGNYLVDWNGNDDSSKPVSSGIYFYSLAANGIRFQKKMILNR